MPIVKISDECYELVSLSGEKYYFKDSNGNIYHRVGGPAYQSGPYEEWYFDGKLHREDGPAIHRKGQDAEYWLNGKRFFSKENWEEALAKIPRHNATGKICKCKECDGINEYVPYQSDYTCYSCKSYASMF